DVEVRAAEFAVGDAVKTQVLLELHDFADRVIFDVAQRGGRDRAALVSIARVEQALRTQETADVIGAERRLRAGARHRLRHGAAPRCGWRLCYREPRGLCE